MAPRGEMAQNDDYLVWYFSHTLAIRKMKTARQQTEMKHLMPNKRKEFGTLHFRDGFIINFILTSWLEPISYKNVILL